MLRICGQACFLVQRRVSRAPKYVHMPHSYLKHGQDEQGLGKGFGFYCVGPGKNCSSSEWEPCHWGLCAVAISLSICVPFDAELSMIAYWVFLSLRSCSSALLSAAQLKILKAFYRPEWGFLAVSS